MENKNDKVHHCFNCGEETEDWDELPNYQKLYICGKKECAMEFNQACQEVEADIQDRAREDNYGRYR